MFSILQNRMPGNVILDRVVWADPEGCACFIIQRRCGVVRGRLLAYTFLEQINFEKVYLLCKDLQTNPCHEMLVGELCLPLSKHLKVKIL